MDRFSHAFLQGGGAFKISVWILWILSAALALVVVMQHHVDSLLDNRKIAAFFWLTVALIWVLPITPIRQSMWNILEIAGTPVILVPFTIMMLWISGLLGLAYRNGPSTI